MAKIVTKYDIGQKVFIPIIESNTFNKSNGVVIKHCEIKSIEVTKEEEGWHITYVFLLGGLRRGESYCFEEVSTAKDYARHMVAELAKSNNNIIDKYTA